MTDPRDRRKDLRAQLLLKVDYQEPQDLLADYLTDLGEGGLFIRTAVPFEVGQRISFNVSFPGLFDPVQLQGIVRWRLETSSASPENQAGVGVEFVFESDERRAQVARLVNGFRDGLEPSPPSPAEPLPAPEGQPFNVLLVEDNQFVHDLFRHAVRKFHREMNEIGSLRIASATNGQEALKYLLGNEVDLAIIDHFLPVMSGSSLVEKMRADPKFKTIPILVVSVGGDGVREAALAAGADLYLDKPVLLKQLLTTLRLLVSKRKFVGELLRSMT